MLKPENLEQYAKKDAEFFMAMPESERQETLNDASGSDDYFHYVMKSAKDTDPKAGVVSVKAVGETAAKDVEGLETTQLTDGNGIESMYAGKTGPQKTAIRKKVQAVIVAINEANRASDEYGEGQAMHSILANEKTAEEFDALNKLEDVSAKGFLKIKALLGTSTAISTPHRLGDAMLANDDFMAALKNRANMALDFAELDPLQVLSARAPRIGQPNAVHDSGNLSNEILRNGMVIPHAVTPVQVRALFPVFPTGDSGVKYLKETIDTDAVAGFAENAILPESAISFEDETEDVKEIGHLMKFNEVAVSDEALLRTQINYRMPEMIGRNIDRNLIMGTGAANHITGINATVGVQSYAKENDETIINAMLKAKNRAAVHETTGVHYGMPNAYVLNRFDCEKIALTLDTDGNYIYADPGRPMYMTLWGIPIAEFNSGTAGTGWVGDFEGYSYIAMRQGVMISTGLVDDQFAKLQQTIRGYVRMCLVVTRPQAFSKITGI